MAGFIAGAWDQPSDAGSVLWFVQGNIGWVAVDRQWVEMLEAKVVVGPPYDGDIFPPVHPFWWKTGNKAPRSTP